MTLMKRKIHPVTRVKLKCAALVRAMDEGTALGLLHGGWADQRDWMKARLGMWGQGLCAYLQRRLGMRVGVLRNPRDSSRVSK